MFAPAQLKVHIDTVPQQDGTVEVRPTFLVNGEEVDPSLLRPSSRQLILGHHVVIPPNTLTVLRNTQGRPQRLSRRRAKDALKELQRQGVIVRHPSGKVALEPARYEVDLHLNTDDTLTARATLTDEQGVVLPKPDPAQVRTDDGWYEVDGNIFVVPIAPPALDQIVATRDTVTLSGDAVPAVLAAARMPVAGMEVEQNDHTAQQVVFPETASYDARIGGDGDTLQVTPTVVFASPQGARHEETLASITTFVQEQQQSEKRRYKRLPKGWVPLDDATLKNTREQVNTLQQEIGSLDDIRGSAIPEFLQRVAELQTSSPWNFYVSDKVRQSHKLLQTGAGVRFRLGVASSGARRLLRLDPFYDHQRFALTHAEVEAAFGGPHPWVRRDRTWVHIDAQQYERVRQQVASHRLKPDGDGFVFPAVAREQVLSAFRSLGKIDEDESYRAFIAKLQSFDQIEPLPLPVGLAPGINLRPYQRAGYDWLGFLQSYGLNGILADDMGLGKTLQTLAAIQYARETDPETRWYPSLVICPVSVVANWQAEAKKFFPTLRVVQYVGNNRAAVFEHLRLWADLVITSYTIATNDLGRLSEVPWRYVVFDEAHQIKNPETKRSKAVKQLASRHKLALTGTPIQNGAEDLWALFDVLMPTFLGSKLQFRDKYMALASGDRAAAQRAAHELKQRTSPFILRRLKRDVAQDLPDKLLIDRAVELTPRQVRAYKTLLGGRESSTLQQSIAKGTWQSSSLQILSLLGKMRDVCNHPALVDQGSTAPDDSGKLDSLQELLEEVALGEHRALLFCQSTRMLDIIASHLPNWNIEHLRLDGSTQASQRQVLVDQFNGSSIPLFLISTKAGGTGLNLTGADTVILYDHDWNPANDQQAIDRAYRIGQTKDVTVYRMISQGTLEDRIIELQARKAALADSILVTDADGIKHLSSDQLLSLFHFNSTSSMGEL